MNEVDMRILGKCEIIKRTKKKTKEWKVLAGASLFFAICYCLGTKNLEYVDAGQAIASNIVWFSSFIAIIIFYILDVRCIKSIKSTEFEIYRLEIEDLNDRKEIAEITGEILSDYVINKQIDKPDENVQLPYAYYGVLLGIDIVLRIYLLVNNIF